MFKRIINKALISAKSRQNLQYLTKYQLLSLFLNQNRFTTHPKRCFSSESSAQEVNKIVDTFRTSEFSPSKQSEQQLGMYYTIPPETANKLFILGGFDKEVQQNFKIFKETAIMVRSPALEVFDYLKRADYSRPVNRYVLCMHFLLIIYQLYLTFNLLSNRRTDRFWKDIHFESYFALWI